METKLTISKESINRLKADAGIIHTHTQNELNEIMREQATRREQSRKDYQRKKAHARDLAIQWQAEAQQKNLSYMELQEAGERFYKLGKRYGLIKEFKENAIL